MSTLRISMIVAMARTTRALGQDNRLLWHIPEDMQYFKKLTTGHVVIMGAKTFVSLGKPLPNRTNIILSHNLLFEAPGCIVVHSVEEALHEARQYEQDEIFIIGGASVYAQILPFTDRLYLTLVEGEYVADTFFPEYEQIFNHTLSEIRQENEKYVFTFLVLERI
ncbi:MAG: dihydrofolate reductase [Minisyncoccota bacterium]